MKRKTKPSQSKAKKYRIGEIEARLLFIIGDDKAMLDALCRQLEHADQTIITSRALHIEATEKLSKLEELFLDAQSSSEHHLRERIAADTALQSYVVSFDEYRRRTNREIADLKAKEYETAS